MLASPKNPEPVAAKGRGLRRQAIWVALLAAVVACPLIYLHIIDVRYMPSSHSDLLPRWVGTQAALHGEDPYSAEVLRRIQIAYYGRPLTPADHVSPQAFFYPAYIIVLLAPLAALSWPAARLVFLLVTCPLLAWSFWLCMRTLQLPASWRRRVVVLVFACFSWPVIWGLRQQQPAFPVAIAIFAAFFLLSRRRQMLPGVLLAMATIKPQLVLPLLAWVLLWAVLRRMWVFIGSFAGTFALLLAATERIVPGWFPSWLAQMREYTGTTHTALPLEWTLGHWPGVVVTGIIAAGSAVALWQMRRCEPDSLQFGLAVSLALATAVTLILADPSMMYNNILLFPACLILIFRKTDGPVAGVVRILALAQLGWDYVAVPLTILGESSGKLSGVWISLPFRDYLLPSLATLSVLIAATRSTGLDLPLLGRLRPSGKVAQGA
jgi:hypothetical protein